MTFSIPPFAAHSRVGCFAKSAAEGGALPIAALSAIRAQGMELADAQVDGGRENTGRTPGISGVSGE